MTKKQIIIAVGIVLLVIAGYFVITHYSLKAPSDIGVNAGTQKTEEKIKIPYDAMQIFNAGARSLSTGDVEYKNKSNGAVVTFHLLTGKDHQFTVPDAQVLVNGKAAGGFGGKYVSGGSFSPDNKYFAFRTTTVCGANCNSYNLYLVDLDSAKISQVKNPRTNKEFIGDASQYVFHEAEPFIESYSWDASHTLNYIFYFIGVEPSTGATYRISQKEEWRYDGQTNKSIFVRTIK